MKLYLDDERSAPDDSWTLVRTFQECVRVLRRDWYEITEISLDHDLGDERRNGYDVLSYIEDDVYDSDLIHVPKIHIHTANPPARKRMLQAVENIEKLQLINVCRRLIEEDFRAERGMYATEFYPAMLSSREAAIIVALRAAGRNRPYTVEDLKNEMPKV